MTVFNCGRIDMAKFIFGIDFDNCRTWIKTKRAKGSSWESIRYACKDSETDLDDFLERHISEDDWPADLNHDIWYEIVKQLQDTENQQLEMDKASRVAQLVDTSEDTKVYVPVGEQTSWQLYRKHLKEDKKFSDAAINNIERSCLAILKRLSSNTADTGPIKGLVIGNVQSGKTANMAGLMAMAADWGWNMFIVLSGTIESLRNQTQKRLFEDLHTTQGNLSWMQLNHLSKKHAVLGERTCDLDFNGSHSQNRYMNVCLKVKSRLSDLIEWIEADKNVIQNMKVLVIDDEADQASINTGNVYTDSERKTINRLILNLVNCRNKEATSSKDNSYQSHYGAMNYISYTATPYANCLNEIGENTLYPQNFMKTLPLSNEYFGPKQIFDGDDPEAATMNIIRTITDDEVDCIHDIYDGKPTEIPESMRESILWFICAAAVMRYYDYKKPVSMLIHTSQKQTDHETIAEHVQNWLRSNKNRIPELCKTVYEKEKDTLTKAELRKVYPDYAIPDNQIWDYPDFSLLIPHIRELTNDITSIYLNEDGELTYSKSIHICIDNCSQNGVTDEGMHMRLAYPDESSSEKPDFSTAFMVIGGNTLSRGLTLEGLVSTFFLRSVKQADTLMQMGRWFGYRRHYELLQRIWMTDDTIDKFEFLADLDNDLRSQLYQMSLLGKSPEDFSPALKNSPKVSWLQLTSKKKMQSIEPASVDYSGMDTQLTVYSKKQDDQINNLQVAEGFLSELGMPEKSENTTAYIWKDIPFDIIERDFLKKFRIPESSRSFNAIDPLTQWVADMTQKGKMGKWSVIVSGIMCDSKLPEEQVWNFSGALKVGKVSRTVKHDNTDSVNIGVLSGKKDYVADIRKEMLDKKDWDTLKSGKDITNDYQEYRKKAGVEKTPLFIIYRINRHADAKKNSNRMAMNMKEDLIGITMVTPGIRTGGNTVTRVKIRSIKTEGRESE